MREQRDCKVAIREAEPEDGPALVEIISQIDNETEFLGNPDEPPPWAHHSEAFLRMLSSTGTGAYFVGIEAGKIVGYLGLTAPRFTSCRGAIFIGSTGLMTTHRGFGIGTKLFDAAEEWARARGAWRLELRCDTGNRHGLALFRKRGFKIEGRVARAFRVADSWRDHYWMAKLLCHEELATAAVADLSPPEPRRELGAVTIRPVRPADGPALHQFNRCLLAEAPIFLMTPDEVAADAAHMERRLAADLERDGQHVLIATDAQHNIIGSAGVWRESYSRAAHDASCLVQVLHPWTGCSIGRVLANRIERWASEQGLKRLTASMQANNLRGRRFAEARGFQLEVVMRRYAKLRDGMVDRIRMMRVLP